PKAGGRPTDGAVMSTDREIRAHPHEEEEMHVNRKITGLVLGALLGPTILLTAITSGSAIAGNRDAHDEPATVSAFADACPADTHWDANLSICD
ncbi:MAG TPA: hypothetical protein VH352_18165, partial [Pseudonocardiaceae bacterium]|nr:hypothetical protein [Pseudonocardiaceae bacterium]